jgi:ABC-type branched-subunit amino acid transport system substrate-binding protein
MVWKSRAFMLSALALACSSPELAGSNFSCETDADCLDGKLCAQVGEALACVPPPLAPIKVGMSAPLQGPSEDLGIEMRRGILSAFSRVNRDGGIGGRQLELVAMNDNYDPSLARQNMHALLDIREEVVSPDEPDVRGSVTWK